MAEMCGNIRYDYSPDQYVTCARVCGVLSVVQLTVAHTISSSSSRSRSHNHPDIGTRSTSNVHGEKKRRGAEYEAKIDEIFGIRPGTHTIISEGRMERLQSLLAIAKFVTEFHFIRSFGCIHRAPSAPFARKAQMLDGQYHRFGASVCLCPCLHCCGAIYADAGRKMSGKRAFAHFVIRKRHYHYHKCILSGRLDTGYAFNLC